MLAFVDRVWKPPAFLGGAWGNRLKSLICLFGSHRRVGRSVWWDGYDFRSVCRRCGAPLYKHGNVRWRRVPARRGKLLMLTHDATRD